MLFKAGVYESEVAEKVQDTFEEYRETQDYKISILSTVKALNLSKASVTSYLPYKKGVYFPSTAEKEKISVGAELSVWICIRGIKSVCTMDTDHLSKGKSYRELPEGRVLFLCTFDPFGRGYAKYSFQNLCKEDRELYLKDGTEEI